MILQYLCLSFYLQCLYNQLVWTGFCDVIANTRLNLAREANLYDSNACFVLQLCAILMEIHKDIKTFINHNIEPGGNGN